MKLDIGELNEQMSTFFQQRFVENLLKASDMMRAGGENEILSLASQSLQGREGEDNEHRNV